VFAGRQDCVEQAMSAAQQRGALPDYDPMPMRDLGRGSLRMLDRIEQETMQDATHRLKRLDPAQLLSVLEAIKDVEAG
jgi:hypothetical protein